MNEQTRIDLPDEKTGTTPISENQQFQTPAPSSSAPSKDFSGTTLGGYQLVRKIAEGGMGVVYEAIQLNLSRKVALKILNEELAARSEFVQRFEREAKAAAALNHPNIVQVHDFGKTQGWCYLIMEYVDGQDLSDYAEVNGKLSILAALDIVEQAAHALKVAGEKSIIHRDI
jgi:serine/threonine-protein kinase